MMKIRSLLLSCLLCGGVCAAQPKDFTGESARKIYGDTLNAALKFWTSPEVIDPTGGYHAWFGIDGKRLKSGDRTDMNKVFQVQMRILYSHAMAIVREKDPAELKRLRSQLEHGWAFLERYRDADSGFYIVSLTEKNEPQGTAIRASGQNCMLHMMSVIAYELKDQRAAAMALEFFRHFDKHFYDSKSGGYFEFPGGKEAPGFPAGTKTTSSNIHSVHALSKLLQVYPDEPVVRARLEELIRILADEKILHPSGNAYRNLTADWKPAEDNMPPHLKAHYGLNAEMVWYLLESAETAMPETVAKILPWAETAARNIMKNGIGSIGDAALTGFYDKPVGNASVLYWWAQTETMVMLAKLYQFTGKKEYFDTLERLTCCAQTYLRAPNGIWYSEVEMKNGVCRDQGGYGWKSGMHVIRAMIALDQSLAGKY